MTIVEQLNKIYYTYEWWQSHEETPESISSYHQSMINKGNIICYTDSDIVLPNDWLANIFSYFNNHPEIDGVGGSILPPIQAQNEIQKFTGELYLEDQGLPEKIATIETL